MQNMLWFTLWVIGPLVPAILIYLVIPKNSATVTGTLKGLQFKLGGAAALYFIVFFFVNPVKLGVLRVEPAPTNWKLIASFKNAKNESVPVKELESIESEPGILNPKEWNDSTLLTLPAVYVDEDKNISIPYRLIFHFKDYESLGIAPSDIANKDRSEISWARNTLSENTIILKNLPALKLKLPSKPKPTDTLPQENADETPVNN